VDFKLNLETGEALEPFGSVQDQALAPAMSKKAEAWNSLLCCLPQELLQRIETKPIDKMVIHVHGGGFVAMSSASH